MTRATGEDCPLRHNSSLPALLVGAHVAGGGDYHGDGDHHDDRGYSAVDINHGDSQTKLIARRNLSWVWVQECTSMWKVKLGPDSSPRSSSSST